MSPGLFWEEFSLVISGDRTLPAALSSRTGLTRIALVYHRANTFGGSFNSVTDVAARLDRNRFQPVAVVPGPGNVADRFRSLGVPLLFCAEHTGERSLRYAARVARAAWLLRSQRIGLVYITDYVTWRSSVLVAARLCAIPRVIHIRAPLSGELIDAEVRQATAVIGNSDASISGLRRLMPEDRLRVVYNFIDLERFSTGRDVRQTFFPSKPAVVGFVGVFRPEKGIEYFLDMARLLRTSHPGVRFLMVGGESTSHDHGWLPRMKGYAEQLGLADVVHFAGPREDIPDIMRSIDVLVVPSLNEGFGRVILEANASGIPVVGADAAGIPEVLENGITGWLVPPRDPEAMARVVGRVLDDEEWRVGLRTEAPERVRARFAPEVQMGRLHEILDAALRRSA